MVNSDVELMRKLLDNMHTQPATHDLDENLVSRGLSKLGMKTANWLSKKFGNLGMDWRSLSQYQTPTTLKMFQTWMRQYRQTYDTVTWFTLNDFFVRNSQLRNIKFTDEITGRTLTKAELAEVFADDRQVLAKILGPKYAPLMPKNASEFNAKVAAKEVIGGGDADAAYAVVVAVVEAALVHMFMLAQPEAGGTAQQQPTQQPTQQQQQPTQQQPTQQPTQQQQQPTQQQQPGGLTADQIDLLRRLLGITP